MSTNRKALKVYANDEEVAFLKEKAESANMTISTYLLKMGMLKPLLTEKDLSMQRDLARCSSVLGKYTGSLIKYLNERGDVISRAEVLNELKTVKATHQELKKVIQKIAEIYS